MKTWLKWVLSILTLCIFLFIAAFFPLQQHQDTTHELTPTFSEIELDFTHQFTKGTFPFLGGAVIDVNNDGNFEILIGGGEGQDDVLFAYNNEFTRLSDLGISDLSATYGIISLDVDQDSDVDLLIARHNGLFFYFNENGKFTKQEISLNLEANSVVFSAAPGDINGDGWVDLYVSTFVNPENFKSATYNDPEHGKENILLLNNGDNTFTDITKTSGAAMDTNTFLSVFLDLNDDGWQDLIVSPNTDTVRIFKNNKDNTFTEQARPTGYGFWMGLGIGDIDQDGDQDFFFSNAANLAPDFLFQGDLKDEQQFDGDWALLRNDGNFKFTNINEEQGLTDMEFAWGAMVEDFNLDGYPELVVAENYIKWFAHHARKFPGRLFVNDAGNFIPVTQQAKVSNYHFGMGQLLVDLNQDGYMDFIQLNMDGPARAFVNDGGSAEYEVITIPDNVESLGKTFTRNGVSKVFVPGEGFMTDSAPQMIFREE
ncbi:hypothetical protein CL620_02145 [archaeon]|nr:hypothetical protein [archaeon]